MTQQNVEFKLGKWVALSTSILILVSFCFALIALPKSGANCTSSCVSYPFTNILDFFPHDYYWMVLATMSVMVYLILMTTIHNVLSGNRKLFSHIGLQFSLMSSITLIIDYLVQLMVIQISLTSNETEGIALLTQYNPHGIFIALESIGYVLMSISFLFIIPVLNKEIRLERWLQIVLIVNILLTFVSLVFIYGLFGLDVQNRFEIAIISINWISLIIFGVFFFKIFDNYEKGRILIDT